jgi:RNA polymerase sigma-70 factor (ECF subfamily)
MDEKENRLVEMVLAGNPGAFETLVTPYRQILLGLAFRLTGNAEDAKEAAQEALMRAYRYLSGFDRNQSFRNWLLSILVNAARRLASKNTHAERLDVEAVIFEPGAGPAARYQHEELRSRLMDSLGTLSRREREVFLLRDIEERDIKETARILRCSSASVRVHLSSARKKVKDAMIKRYPDRGEETR